MSLVLLYSVLIRHTDEAAALHWPDDVEDRTKMVMPGDNVEMMCDVHNPIALESGLRFNIREGGHTVSYFLNSFSPNIESIWSCQTCSGSIILPRLSTRLKLCYGKATLTPISR